MITNKRPYLRLWLRYQRFMNSANGRLEFWLTNPNNLERNRRRRGEVTREL